MAECFAAGYVNPASQHRAGQAARQRLESARSQMLGMLGGVSSGMQTDRLILTSGGTESNNLAIAGLAHAVAAKRAETGVTSAIATAKPLRILISAVEHPSVIAIGQFLMTQGFLLEMIPVDECGVVDLEDLERRLQSHPREPIAVVSIMMANNETGVIEPVAQAAALCRQHDVLFHTDAVQAVGKTCVDFREIGADAMTFTGHKFHGPRGIGGLILRHGVDVQPSLYGGFQQMATRPGTEDVSLTVGMLQALLEYEQDGDREQSLSRKRDQLEQAIVAMDPTAVINGQGANRLPHTLNVSFPGINRQAFLLAADFAGLAISTGSACASGSSERSHVIIAMGAPEAVIEGSVRISVGANTTQQEIDDAITVLQQVFDRLSTTRSG